MATRLKDEYLFDRCARCQRVIEENERFSVIVMESTDGSHRVHMALCKPCDLIEQQRGHGGLKNQ